MDIYPSVQFMDLSHLLYRMRLHRPRNYRRRLAWAWAVTVCSPFLIIAGKDGRHSCKQKSSDSCACGASTLFFRACLQPMSSQQWRSSPAGPCAANRHNAPHVVSLFITVIYSLTVVLNNLQICSFFTGRS